MVHDKTTESFVAVGSFLASVALAFTSLLISEDHDIAAGVLMMCAQFLMLTATIFGLDYKLWQNGITKSGSNRSNVDDQSARSESPVNKS